MHYNSNNDAAVLQELVEAFRTAASLAVEEKCDTSSTFARLAKSLIAYRPKLNIIEGDNSVQASIVHDQDSLPSTSPNGKPAWPCT